MKKHTQSLKTISLLIILAFIPSVFTLAQTVNKPLYLTDPGTGLDRVRPILGDGTVSSTTLKTNGGAQTFLDQFTTSAYTNTNGTANWSATPWIETDAGGAGATVGNILITGGILRVTANNTDNIYRPANLAGASVATISYSVSAIGMANLGHGSIIVEIYDGATYRTLETVIHSTTIGARSYALNAGELNANFRIRIRGVDGNAAKTVSFDDMQIAATFSGVSTLTFTQGTPMCSSLTMPTGGAVSVTAYVNVVSGTLPASPSVSAVLRYTGGPVVFATLTNPAYSSAAGTITWTGNLGSAYTIPAGSQVELVVTTTETAADFSIRYNSTTYPSSIGLPTTTPINIDTYAVYNAGYSGGSIITSAYSGNTVYARAVVSDPFGFDDITALDLQVSTPLGAVSTYTATSVATSGCTRTFEYAWTIPSNLAGNFSLRYTAKEGTEASVTNIKTQSFNVITPSALTVTKTLTSPATGPYTINSILSFNITINNTGTIDITSIPLQDVFDVSCLQYLGSVPVQNSVAGGNISWTNVLVSALTPGSTANIAVNFKVTGNCDPSVNTSTVSGAIDVNGYLVPTGTFTSSVNITIDEPPVAVNDRFSISAAGNLNVLANDTDPDGDLTTVSLVSSPDPLKATVTVNLDNTISFTPLSGLIDDEILTFTYRVCDNANPTPYCSEATVTVVFSDFNDAPSLTADITGTLVDLPITIAVLANDSDIDGNLDLSGMSITTAPSFGVATLNPDHTITYVPNPGFIGTDQLTYEICDDGFPVPVECVSATVTINVIFAEYVCQEGSNTLSVPAVPGATGYTWTLPAGATGSSTTNSISVDWAGVTPGEYNVCVEPTNYCGPGTQQCVKIVVTKVTLSAVPTDLLCFGSNTGAIDLTVNSGVPPYTYSWTRSGGGYIANIEDITSLAPGTYTVVVTDKYGCTATTSATVAQPATAVTVTASLTDEAPYGAANGAINITPAGGTPGYAYSWSNGSTSEDITNLASGTYTVTITDNNGCTVVQSFTVDRIGGPLEISLIASTNVNCFGGSTGTINLEIIGGAKPYGYLWTRSGDGATFITQDLTNIPAGTYSVVITDNIGATAATSVIITQPATALSITDVTLNNLCFGTNSASINITVSDGTPPYTYLWTTGDTSQDISGLTTGTYGVTVTDANGCTESLVRSITTPDELTVIATLVETACDPGNTGSIDITPAGGALPYSFSWSNGEITEDITGLTAGNYSVTITDDNGCSKIVTYVIESSCIGLAKTVSEGPINHGDGSYTMSYDIKVENKGTVSLQNIQVTEDLKATFASASGFTFNSLNIIAQPMSNSWTLNSGYDGDATAGLASDINLISPTGSLVTGESAIFRISVTVIPGAILSPYNNTASATGSSAAGKLTADDSQTGTVTDPDTDGNPGNNDVPTPVTFPEGPELGLSKTIAATPINNNDGSYTFSYNIKIQNTGDILLSNVQITDDLSVTFPGLTISGISSAILTQPAGTLLTASGSYDGSSDTQLLSGSNTLNPGESGIVQVTLTVNLNGSAGPFSNSATGNATSPAGTPVTDISQNGTNPDPDTDGNPGNNSVPTPVTFTENPEIGVAKILTGTPVNNLDGTYTLSYRFRVQNTGDVPLTDVQVTDDLATTFPGLTLSGISSTIITQPLSSVLTANAGFDGDTDTGLLSGASNLYTGEYAILEVELTVQLNGSKGPFNNTAQATGTGIGGHTATDNSVNGTIVDPNADGNPTNDTSPTPVTFSEQAEIGIAKAVGVPVNNNDGTYTVTYSIKIENTGNVPLNNVQATDNLATTFTGASSWVVTGVTSALFAENYPGYDGNTDQNLLAGTDILAVGASGTVIITVNVTPATKMGVYSNTAAASGIGSGGTSASDNSYNGTNVDPDNDGNPTNNASPTPLTFTESPQIGLAKTIPAAATNNGDGTFTLTYEIRVENTGNVPLSNVQVNENLSLTFAAATSFSFVSASITTQPVSSTFVLNGAYNGAANSNLLNGTVGLLYNEFALIEVTVTVRPGAVGGPYENSANGTAQSPTGRYVVDFSQDGTDVDPDNNGQSTDNNVPTPVIFSNNPLIGLSKSLVSVTDNRDFTNTVTFLFRIENFGDITINDLEVYDDIATQFAGVSPTDFTAAEGTLFANGTWDGTSASNILAPGQSIAIGAVETVSISFKVTPGSTTTLNNNATVEGTSAGGSPVSDTSTNGLDPDGTDDDNVPDESVPTPVPFILSAELEILKTAPAGLVLPGQMLTYTISVTNNGPLDAENVVITDAISAFPSPEFSTSLLGPWSTWFGTQSVGTLTNGSSYLLYIRGNVPAGCTSFGNTATVSTTTNEIILTDNTSTVTVDRVLDPSDPYAGADQSLCNTTSTTLAATTPVVGTGAWSIWDGTGGSFGSVSSPISSFSGVAGESYLLRWTTTLCNSLYDEVVITFNENPVVSITGLSTVCIGYGTTVSPVTGGTWTSSDDLVATVTDAGEVTAISAGTATFTFTSTATGCSATTPVVTVTPVPTLVDPADKTICNGAKTNIVLPTIDGITYTWTATGTAVGFSDCSLSCGDEINQTLLNGSSSPATVTYVITPHTGSCDGPTQSVTVTVNPSPFMPDPPNVTICSGATTAINLTSPITGATVEFSWTAVLTSGTVSGYSNGSGTPIAQTLVNTSGSVGVVTYTITPHIGSCNGATREVSVTVNPNPAAPTIGTITQPTCSTAVGSVELTGLPAGNWTINPGAIAGTGASYTVTNLSANTYNYTVTNSAGCISAASLDIVINAQPATPPMPTVTATLQPTCITGTGTITITAPTGTGMTYSIDDLTYTNTTGEFTLVTPGTYPVTAKNSDGCISPAGSVTINLPPAVPDAPVVGVITQPTCVTTSGSVVLSGLPSSGDWTLIRIPGNVTTAGSGISTTISGLSTGTYTYTVTNAAGCVSPESIEIDIDAVPPTPDAIAGADREICLNANTQIGAAAVSGNEYSWTSAPAGFTSSVANPTVTPTVTTTYTLVETITATGCTNTNSVTVTVNPLPAAEAGADREICLNANTQIGAAAVSGNEYSWNSVPAGFTSSVANPTVAPTVTTTYTLVETITATGCTNTNSVTVTVNPLPAAVAGADREICLNANTQIGAVAVSGNEYSWTSVPAGFTSTTANPTVAPTVTTTYTLVETITATGCTNTNSVTVTVNPLPAAVAGADREICLNANTQIGAAAIVGNEYSWTSVPSGFTSTTANPTVTPTVTTTYTLVETITATGCTNTNSVTVTVNPLPAAVAGADRDICQNANTQIGAAAVVGNEYSWTSVPAGFTSSVANPTVAPTVTTTYTLVETITATGCTNTNSVTVTVNPLPAAVAGADREICLNANTQIGAAAIVGNEYSWTSVPSGFTSTTANPTVAPTATTTYTLVETITATGCTNTNSVTITVNPLPAAVAGADREICLNANTQIGAVAVSGNEYSWTSVPAGFTSSVANPTVVPTVTTTYTLVETITATGCTNTNSVTVTVNPLPAAVAGADRDICLNANTQIGAAAVSGNEYSWTSVPAGFTSTVANPTVTPTVTTTYTLVETITATGCTNTNSVTVTVNPLPAAVAGADREICLNANTQIGAVAVSGNEYSWTSVPAGFTSSVANPTVTPSVTTTYTLVETITATGCTNTNSVTVTVNPLPAAVAGADREICLNANTQIGAAAIVGNEYSWTSVPSGFTSTTANPTVAPTVTTTYTLVETITATGCTNTNSVTVTVNPLPAAVAGADREICLNANTQIGAATVVGNEYSWTSVPAGFTSSVANPTVAPTVTTTYTLIETITATGCTNTNSVTVTVNPLPAAVAGADREICLNANTQIGAAAIVGNEYSWTSVPAGFTSTTANPTVTPGVTTTYTLVETITATGCANTNSVTVTVNPLPAAVAGADREICLNANTQIGAVAVSGNEYSWTSVPAGFTSSVANPTVAPTVTTSYTLVETITATGCTNTNSVTVTVNPLPAAVAGADREICLNANTQIGAAAVVGNEYSWTSVPSGFTSTTANPTVAPTVTTTYTLVETITATGCTNTNSVTVTVNPLPAAVAGADREICLNANTQIGAATVVGNEYSWTSVPAGFTSSVANPTVAPTVTTTYTLIETITATGCTNTNSVTVTVNPLPAAVAGADRDICLNANTQIGAAAVSGNEYSWTSVPAGFTSTTANPTVTPGVTTTYTLVETITATGCTNTNSVTVTVNPLPAAVAGADREICLNANTQIGATAVSGNEYSWTSAPAGFTSSVANPTVAPTVTTTYTLVETITATGCTNTNSVTITVNPLPAAVAGADRDICLNANTQIGAAAVSGNEYSWTSVPTGFTSSVANPTVTPTVTTTYTLIETISATGCTNTNSVTVTVNPLPAAVAGADREICLNANTQIGAAAVVGNEYSWTSVPAGFTSTAANPTVSPTVTTTYTLVETITATGCTNTNSVTVTVNPLPAAVAGADRDICLNANTQIGSAVVVGNEYSWTSVPAGFTSSVANPTVAPTVTTTYTLVETITATGCTNTNSVTVTVNPLPAAVAGADRDICLNANTQIGAAAVSGNEYSWTSVLAGFTSTVANPTVAPTVTTTYTLVETITATGCTNTNSVTVTVNPLPAAVAGADREICLNANTQIGAVAVSGNEYSWTSVPAGFTSSVANPTVVPTVTTTYTLVETITATGCTNTNSVTVTVNPLPAAVAGADRDICLNANTQIGAAAVSGNEYSWTSVPAGFTSSVANPTVAPTVTTTYTLVETITATGCTNTNSVTVTVNPLPAAVAGADREICLNANTQIGAAAIVGNEYSWTSVPSGFTSTTANPTVAPTVTTTYTLVETITATGCTNTNSVTITVNPLPAAVAGADREICLNANTQIGAVAVSGNEYSWTSVPAGFTSSVANPTVAPTVTTTYTLVETITATGCTNTNSVTVTVNPLPAAVAGADRDICLNANTQIGAAAVSGNEYSWTSVPAGFTSTVANPTVAPTVTTTYTLVETITATGCTNTNSVTVTVNPLPAAVAGADREICLNANTQIGAVAVSGNEYSWTSAPAGFTSSVANPTVDPTVTTTYTLVETITATGCTNTNSVTVTVNPLPAAVAGADREICLNANTQIGAAAIVGNEYSWTSVPSGFTSTTANPTVAPTVTTTYTLVETITATGCTNTNSVTVTVNPLPDTPTVTVTQTTCAVSTGTITISAPTETGMTYSIDGLDYTNTTGVFTLISPGTYSVTAKNSLGCISDPESAKIDDAMICPPIATDDSKTGNVPGVNTTLNILTNDDLGDGSDATPDAVTVDLDLITAGIQTTLTITGEGTWTYNALTGELTFDPEVGFSTDPTPIDYQLTEIATGLTDDATVTVTYDEVPPVATNDSSTGNVPGVNTTLNILTNDDLGDGSDATPDAVTVDLDLLTAGVQTTLTVTDEGTWTYNPSTGELTFDPLVGFTTDPTPIAYQLTEISTGLTDNATVTVTYDEVPPVATNDSKTGNVPGVNTTLNILTNDDLGDGSDATPDAVTVDLDLITAGVQTTLTITGEGTWTYNALTGELTFDPEVGFSTDPTLIDYQLTEIATGLTDNATVTVTYDEVPPVATNDNKTGNVPGVNTTLNILTNDDLGDGSDATPDAVTVDLDLITAGVQTTLIITDEGTWIYNALTGELTFDPQAGFYTDPTPIDYQLTEIATGLSDNATVTYTYLKIPTIALEKTGTQNLNVVAPNGRADVGDQITYAFTVTNTGNTTLTNVTVTDPVATIIGSPIASMAPGEINSTAYTAVYTLTQADIDAGTFTNEASVTGTSTAGPDPTGTDTDTQILIQVPALNTVKTTGSATYSSTSDVLNYTIMVTNTGNVTVSNITLADANATVTCDTNPFTLKPGESFTCTATHNITLADLNAGHVDNIATATGLDPNGDPVTDPSDTVTVTATQTPLLMTVKTAMNSTYSSVGEEIDYLIRVTNMGNITINGITLSDPNAVVSCTSMSYNLLPGQSFTCTAIHTVTQADLDAGKVNNIATATGTDINGNRISDPSDLVTVTATQYPALTTIKTALTQSFTSVGEEVLFSITVINSGNVTISGITPTDHNATLTCGASTYTLMAGESFTCTASHIVTLADLNAGRIENIASATGTDINGKIVTSDPSVLVVVTANFKPSWTMVKSSITEPNTYSEAGDVLTYSIALTNTGNTAITGVNVSDPQADAGSVQYVSGDTGAAGILEIGESWIFSARHTITQANIDAGSFTNTVTATGTPTGGILDPATDSETVTATLNPAWILTKTSTTQPNSYAAAGDLLTYSISLVNTGNVTISNVIVSDPQADAGSVRYVSGDAGIIGKLEVGETWMYTASHTATLSDLNAGSYTNTATATGTPAGGILIPATDNETVYAIVADLVITKTAQPKPVVAGENITYTITVTNSGNSDAKNVVVTDLLPADLTFVRASMTTGSWLAPNWTLGTLANGATETLTLVARVNNRLVTNVVNTATVTTTTHDPDTDDNTSTDETRVVIVLHPELTITKSAMENSFSAVGDRIHYNFDVINTGEVTLHNVTVADPNAEITGGIPISILPPGMGALVTAVHTVTQADIDAGRVINTALATSTDPNGDPVVDTSNTVTTNGLHRPQITATKFVSENTYWAVGDVINYTIEIFNCGNVTVKNIITTDPNAVITSGNPVVSLEPRQTVMVAAIHVVTQADLDLGKIDNTASITGTDPAGKPVSDESNLVTIYARQSSRMIISETALESSFSVVGDTLHYAISVKNPGSMTISDIIISSDNATPAGSTSISRLAAGETVTIMAARIITQADLNTGKVVTFAIATALNPDNTRFYLKGNEVTVFATQKPGAVITKTADETTFSAIGDLIHYNNEIRNTGNVKITGITFTDPNTVITGSSQIGSLNPGQSVIIKTARTITQTDLNIGYVETTAAISGNDPNSQPIRINSNKLIITGSQHSTFTTALTAAESSFDLAGDIIHYSIEILNTGNVTLTNLMVNDPDAQFINGSTLGYLLPGAKAIVTAERTIIAADLSAGKVVNRAIVSGYTPAAVLITGASNELTILAHGTKGLSISKVARETVYSETGEIIHFDITVKNSGNVPVSNITVADPNALIPGNPVIGSLAASGMQTLTATHIVTQEDLDAGFISNTASIAGLYPDGATYTLLSNTATVFAKKDPLLSARLSAVETTFLSIGDQINYTIEVKNAGNRSVSDIILSAQSDLVITGSPVVSLAPGKTAQLTAVYTVTPTDLDAGIIVKTVSASGKDPDRQPVTTISNEITVTGTQNPELSARAVALETTYSEVGEVIHYNIVVKNSGNVSIISTAVTDPNAVIITVRPITILMPGDSVLVSASHIVTQTDIDAGKVITGATATGFDLNGKTIEKTGNPVIVYATQHTELNVSATASKSIFRNIGEVVEYSIQMKNLGNTTLVDLDVTDPNAVILTASPATTLKPGEITRITASRTITQADLDEGEVVNVAKAEAMNLSGKTIQKSGNRVTVRGVQQPELTTATSASVSTYRKEGEIIRYTVLVTNTGNVTMNNISVTDAKVLLDFSKTITSLAPGESGSVTADHSITLEDINSGKIVTAGIAHGYLANAQEMSYMSKAVTVRLFMENYNLTNYPNPFSYETNIVFDLPEKGEVILKVYDLTGREIAQIDKKEYNEGRNYVHWTTHNTQKGLFIVKLYYRGDQAVRMISVVN